MDLADCMPTMYSAVPPPDPPDQRGRGEEGQRDREEEMSPLKPRHLSEDHWKKFQELRARRERECGGAARQQMATTRNKALRAVRQELSVLDRAVLEEEGVELPEGRRRGRGRKKQRREDYQPARVSSPGPSPELETRWQEVRKCLDSNPQLKGVDKGKYAPKSKLEEELDEAIEQGRLGEASSMSDRLAQREFATQVATAFDRVSYTKRRKMEEERKKRRKPKLQWTFEHKQRWESKGNM